jgi:hypothetical protein
MDPFAYFNNFLNKNGIDNKAYGMFVLSAATYMPGESREPFLVICQARTRTVEHTPPPTETRVRGFQTSSSSTQDVETNSNGNIACECV